MKWLFYLRSKFGEALEDVDYPEKHPMGGSESLALRLIKSLRSIGHDVQLTTKLEDCSNGNHDVFISLRALEPFKDKPPNDRLNYLWCQDDTDQPFLQPLRDEKISSFLFENCNAVIVPSHYAANNWAQQLHTPLPKLEVIPNAIPTHLFDKIDAESLKERPPYAYYASTPQRGLKELALAWPEVIKAVPQAQLFVASSMKMYNSEDDAELQKLFDQVKNLPNTTYLGGINQQEVRKAASKCRALAYPCTFAETGCISAMEAMASGCAVVSTALGALPESAWRNPLVEPTQNKWLSLWTQKLIHVFTDDDHYTDIARTNLRVSELMGLDYFSKKWLLRVKSDLAAKGLQDKFQPKVKISQ